MDLTLKELAELTDEKPLESISIGGRRFRVGILSPEQWADIDAWERRIAQARIKGEPLIARERDPTRILVHLLWGGQPHSVYKAVLRDVKREHLLAAKREATRQRLLARALD